MAGEVESIGSEVTKFNVGDRVFGTTVMSIHEYDQFWNETMTVDFEDGFASYRAIKSLIPWSISRPEISCDAVNSTLSGPVGAASYLWSTGDTTESITITATGMYQLWTNKGDGLMSSEPYEVADLNTFCQFSGLLDLADIDFSIYPNPANDKITIKTS